MDGWLDRIVDVWVDGGMDGWMMDREKGEGEHCDVAIDGKQQCKVDR